MEMMKYLVLLVVGIALLVKGADFFVEGSASVAALLKVPSIIIGLTVVAMGTSLPELSVSVAAGLSGSNEIAVSNVVGSNLCNTMLVLGACAVLCRVPVERNILKRDLPLSIGVSALLALLALDAMSVFFTDQTFGSGQISRLNGILLLILFAGYMFLTVRAAVKSRREQAGAEPDRVRTRSLPICILFIVGGAVAIKFGGDFVVDSAKYIARALGMSETLIGLTIVAVGTSLPELATSLMAAKKGETDLAVGNVVGSNLFNILLILGVSATISPISVTMENLTDMVILLVFTIVFYFYARSKRELNRWEGVVMLALYVLYIAYAIVR